MAKKRHIAELEQAIGSNIRTARLKKGITQQGLAGSIGVSYQQLQKYETGTNRVSASMLIKIGETLAVSPCAFLDQTDADIRQQGGFSPSLIDKEVLELVDLYTSIESKETRKLVKRVLVSLAKQDPDDG